MSEEVILYDIPTKGSKPHCWSLNPWKVRAALNYKKIPYKTAWIEYPDIAPTLKDVGLEPNDTPNATPYTCPAVKLPDGTFMMDSRPICTALENLHPEPSLHMSDTETMDRARDALAPIWVALRPLILPRVPEMLLPERSAEYFHRTREQVFGMSLAEVAKSEAAVKAWENVGPGLEGMKAFLTESKEGPFVMGKTVSFADFAIAGAWAMMKCVDKEGDLFGRVMNHDPVLKEHWEAVQPWFERDD